MITLLINMLDGFNILLSRYFSYILIDSKIAHGVFNLIINTKKKFNEIRRKYYSDGVGLALLE